MMHDVAIRAGLALGVVAGCCAGAAMADALVVLNKSEANVSIIDPASRETVATVAVGVGPHEAATAADGRTVVVCNYGDQTPGSTLTVIDAKAGKALRTFDLDGHQRPHGIQFLPDGRIVVTAESQRKLLIVDIEKGAVDHAIDTDAQVSHMVAVTPDGKRAFVPNIGSGSCSVIDLEAKKLLKVVPTGAGAEGIAVHPTRPEAWVTNRAANTVSVIDTESLEVTATIECGDFPIRAAITPDGKHVLVSCAQSGEVVVIDPESRAEVKRISMGEAVVEGEERRGRLFENAFGNSPAPIGILIEPGGKKAYIANTLADIVTVIDLERLEVIGRIQAGRQPDGMAWAANG
ncbi:MAG: cytochrome D1 domain-containing protein [Planctomycetota bacterium]|nr:cytochrome D1 domain-containing protein [Planctomycetota bacterium]